MTMKRRKAERNQSEEKGNFLNLLCIGQRSHYTVCISFFTLSNAFFVWKQKQFISWLCCRFLRAYHYNYQTTTEINLIYFIFNESAKQQQKKKWKEKHIYQVNPFSFRFRLLYSHISLGLGWIWIYFLWMHW